MDTSRGKVVISGVSGRFPRSANMREFERNLYEGVEMIDGEETRWEDFNEEVPIKTGKIGNLEKFDAQFFSILNKHANWTDPQIRMLLEHSYEAILDAGVSPQSLFGSRTGVFIGNSETDSKDVFSYQIPTKEGYGMMGNAGFYLANRISFVLGLEGPSMRVDTACSSVAYAINCAFDAIQSGACDAALVGGSNLIMSFLTTTEFYKGKILSPTGIGKPFDESSDGFSRSEAVGVFFMQRAADAKRVYATVINSSVSNDGFKEEGPSFPSRVAQEKLMRDVFASVNVDPSEIAYVEAHATGTLGDVEEVAAIDNFFCHERKEPLKIGSVKSNMGHAEAASAFASLSKVLLAFETGRIAPNINLKTPRSDIKAIQDGRVKVVTEPEDIGGDLIAMNSFGLGGANAHILLRRNGKIKHNWGRPSDSLDRLVLWSGRSDEAIRAIFDHITAHPLDAEFIALLQSSQVMTNYGNNKRGFGIFRDSEERAECIQQHRQDFDGKRKPIVFVYNGIGSQWPQMGVDLMRIPIFAQSIEASHEILYKRGVDLKRILMTADKNVFSKVLHSYVGIIAIEIALTDVLTSLGIKPDFIVGHSLGELGCAYADGCLTAEETILVAYSRGIANNESKSIEGAMAAVGMSHEDIFRILPVDIDIACHNSSDSTTVSGPKESVEKFTAQLVAEGIFVREVHSSGAALHSRYLADFGEKLYERLKTVIASPRKRSEKWLSSTYAKPTWTETEEPQFASPEYFVKNLINPVLFREVTDMLPRDVITIEIGPHALLKALLKRSLSEGTHVSLTQRDELEGVRLMMSALGQLFEHGVDMDASVLYPPIAFPVARGTAMIAPLVKWNHSDNFIVPIIDRSLYYQRRIVAISLSDKNFSFIQDHIIDGRILIPGMVLFTLVWETFRLMYGNLHAHTRIAFEDVKLTRVTFLERSQEIHLCININRGTGYFEVTEKTALLAHGFIRKAPDHIPLTLAPEEIEDPVMLSGDDFGTGMRLRGYHHQGTFRGIKEIRDDGVTGQIEWFNNWATFLDAILQAFMLMDDTRALVLPTYVGKLVIDPEKHLAMLDAIEGERKSLTFVGDKATRTIVVGGVEIHNFDGSEISRRRELSKLVLESHKFVANFSPAKFSRGDAAKICAQLAVERALSLKCKCIEISEGEFISPLMHQALKDIPGVKFSVTLLTQSKEEVTLENIEVDDREIASFTDVDLIVGRECTRNESFLESIKSSLKGSGLLISVEREKLEKEHKIFSNFKVIARFTLDDGEFFYILTQITPNENPLKIVKITSTVEDWLEPLKSALKEESQQVVAFAQRDTFSGILGLINCIRREPLGAHLRSVFIDDDRAPPFTLDNSFYRSQLELGFPINVFKEGAWGTYRHVNMPVEQKTEPQTGECYLRCLAKGDLSTLTWMRGSLDTRSPSVIRIHYSSLNFKDLMLALGRITPNVDISRIDEPRILGVDWSGVTHDGKRVMGAGTFGGLCTQIDGSSRAFWEMPESWTLEEAATVPIVYFTVYMGFFHHFKIKRGKSMLIHSGAGGVGQSAIQVALSYGLEVFTTVGSADKRQYLLEKFPQLKAENIGNSRDTSFERLVMTNTRGRGVDYVLNSLSGDKLQASLRCLAKCGIFLEIGKFDMMSRTKIDMRHFAKDISLVSMFAENALLNNNREEISKIMLEDIKRGIVKPLDFKTFRPDEVEEAFRYMAAGKQRGKVLIKMRDTDSDVATLPMTVVESVHCFEQESFVIVGGLGGFGLELADFLIIRGCKNLLISSSRGVTSGYQAYRIKLWQKYGVRVVVSTANAATREGCRELLSEVLKLGKLGGIFNLAVALRDAPFEEQSLENFEQSLAPKAAITRHLDELSRDSQLRYFVVFSSVSCGRGNVGQSNYGMANSIMERIVEKRHRQGLPAKAIQWGAIGNVGLLASVLEKNAGLNVGGTVAQSIYSCFDVFDSLLASRDPIVESMIIAKSSYGDGKKVSFMETMLNILGIQDKKTLSMDTSLSKLGIDSLIAVEIQQVLERDYDLLLSAQELRSLTLRDLERRVLKKDDSPAPQSSLLDIKTLMVSQFGDEATCDQTILNVPSMSSDETVKALIIPGFEGMANDLTTALAKQLNCPTYILQVSKCFDATNLQDMLTVIWNDVIDLFEEDEKFIIVGYSFGCLLGLKIASLLESLEKRGRLIMIDGSPQFVRQLAQTLLVDVTNDDELRHKVLAMTVKLTEPSITEQEIFEILKLKTFEEQFAKFKQVSKNQVAYSERFHRETAEALFNRSKISLELDENLLPTLQWTPITLLRSKESSIGGTSSDYGLERYSSEEVEVHTVEGNHYTMLEKPKLAKIINETIRTLKST